LDHLKVEELPMPVPKAGEVLVKVFAAAINPSDGKNVLGKMAETKLPRVPGRDFAGRVVSGDSFWNGKPVFGTGAIETNVMYAVATKDDKHAFIGV
jgi:NADPH2:quinone reductase